MTTETVDDVDIDADTPLRLPELDVSEADDGLVILTPDGGQVHHLNGTASLVFELCDGRTTVAAIADAVAATVSAGPLHVDQVVECVRTLRARGIVT